MPPASVPRGSTERRRNHVAGEADRQKADRPERRHRAREAPGATPPLPPPGSRRGTSVKDLNAKLRTYNDGWNDRARPFTWITAAGDILKKAERQKISSAEHQSTTTRTRPAGSRATREGSKQ